MSREQSATLVALGTKADQQSAENGRQEKILKIFTVVTVVFVSFARRITICTESETEP